MGRAPSFAVPGQPLRLAILRPKAPSVRSRYIPSIATARQIVLFPRVSSRDIRNLTIPPAVHRARSINNRAPVACFDRIYRGGGKGPPQCGTRPKDGIEGTPRLGHGRSCRWSASAPRSARPRAQARISTVSGASASRRQKNSAAGRSPALDGCSPWAPLGACAFCLLPGLPDSANGGPLVTAQ